MGNPEPSIADREKAKLFRSLNALVVLAVILAAAGFWWFYGRGMVAAAASGQSAAAVVTGIQPYSGSGEVPANYLAAEKVVVHKVPGTLTGDWEAKGSSAKIKGAADDTLVQFRVRAPNGKVLYTADHKTRGSFPLRLDAPGAYLLEADNSGIIRSSARWYKVQGQYLAD